MGWYKNNVPTDWETALERRSGSLFTTEVIYDPEGSNVTFGGKYDVLSISPIEQEKDIDPELGLRPVVKPIRITLNDPDQYLDPDNPSGLFYSLSPIGKSIIVNIHNNEGPESKKINIFTGIIDVDPEAGKGICTIVCSPRRRYILQQKLVGADSDIDQKLKAMNRVGGLVDSVTYNTNWNNPPFEFSVSNGSLPTGLTLNSDGTVTGTPTEEGETIFTVQVRNSEGVTRELDCKIVVYTPLNNHFDADLGWSTYTQVANTGSPAFSLEEHESFARITPDASDYWWRNTPSQLKSAPYFTINRADGNLTGNWIMYGQISGEGHDAGGTYAYTGLFAMTGDYTGYLVGIESTATPGSYNVLVHKADTDNNVHRTAISTNDIWVKMEHNDAANTLTFYYKLTEPDTWIQIYQVTGFTSTVTGVGFKVMGLNVGEYGEIHELYWRGGDLDFDVSNIFPSAAVNVPYSTPIRADGGAGDYAFEISEGSLPSGLLLIANDEEAIISGTPTEARSATFKLKVTDGNGTELEEEFSLTALDDVFFYPSTLPEAPVNTAYDESFTVYGSGNLDREQVTIGSNCELGLWTIIFSNESDFVISGPGVAAMDGSIETELDIEGVINIPVTAWDGIFFEDMEIKFITGISYTHQNAVQIIYDLYLKGGVPNTVLDASSYFGNIDVGTPFEGIAAGSTTLNIRVEYPTIIKTAETIIITEGETSEEVTVNVGNGASSSFPPYITLTITATANSYSEAATVTWKQRNDLDTSYSFDEFYQYCDTNDFNVSITFDRPITILQAVEVVSLHGGIYVGQSLGKERVAGLIERASESLQTIDSQYILKDSVHVENGEIINVFNFKYALDYIEDEYLNSYTYPETDEANNSFQNHGFKSEAPINLPGYYDPAPVQTLAALLYKIFSNGPRYITVGLDLMAIVEKFGDRFNLDSAVPDIETTVEIIGFTMYVRDRYYFNLKTFDRSLLTT